MVQNLQNQQLKEWLPNTELLTQISQPVEQLEVSVYYVVVVPHNQQQFQFYPENSTITTKKLVSITTAIY